MTFDEYVIENIGPKPAISKGCYSPERRAWDARYVQLLDGGINVGLSNYQMFRGRKRAVTANVAATRNEDSNAA